MVRNSVPLCFVNYQLHRNEGTGLDDHAHGIIHSICQLIILVIIKQIYTVSWILNKDSRIHSSADVIVCWLVLGYYSTQCGLRDQETGSVSRT